jgi:hypothetical protein
MSTEATTWAWKQNIKSSDKLVLLCLAEHADPEGYVKQSPAALAQRTQLAEVFVKRSIDELLDRGLIREHGDGWQLQWRDS